MTKHRPNSGTAAPAKPNPASDNRVAQRHHKQSQGAQLSSANVEESPHMDRGDSAEGAGQSLSHGREDAAKSLRRGALDTQYGTRSSMKTGEPPKTGEPSAGSAGPDAGAEASKGGDRPASVPNPGSSEDSSGAERDTMGGSRPGSGA